MLAPSRLFLFRLSLTATPLPAFISLSPFPLYLFSLSIIVKGLLCLRLLLREPLTKRAWLSNLMEVDEWEKVEDENEGEKEHDDEFAKEAASVRPGRREEKR